MEITFLGTGAGIPSKERNVTAIVLNLLQEINELWLFDCGEATQHQLLHTTLKPRKINKIFITHLHGDHLFGLPGLLSSRSFQGGDSEVIIYGPKGVKSFIETTLAVSQSHLSYPIHFVELDEEGLLFETDAFTVYTTKLTHNIESWGFRINEKDKMGQLNVAKLKEQGIQPGPIYRDIKNKEKVILDNGEALYRKDFVGAPKQGKSVVIFGDTKYMPAQIEFAKNANLLVHEATFAKDANDLANNYFHSTTAEAARLARDSEVKKLIMTHISSRYQGDTLDELLTEAQAIFSNTAIAADFKTFTIE